MKSVKVSAPFIAGLCLLLYCLPLRLTLPFLLSAALHEAAHAAVCKLTGAAITEFSIGLCGAQMQAEFTSRRQAFFCIAAGPACNLLLLLFLPVAHVLSLCSLLLAVYNLLPLQTLDGGRLLALFCSDTAVQAAELICVLLLGVFGVMMCCFYHAGLWSCIFAASVIIKSQALEKALQIPLPGRKIKKKHVEVLK